MKMKQKNYKIHNVNLTSVIASHQLGIGCMSLQRFFSFMGISSLLQYRYDLYKSFIGEKLTKYAKDTMNKARKEEKKTILDNETTVDTIAIEHGSKQHVQKQKKPFFGNCELNEFREEFEKRQEKALARELKMNLDYTMLPKIIWHKAQALKLENEAMQAKIAGLEATLYATEHENYLLEHD